MPIDSSFNNEKIRPLLRGEGEREGKFFRLQTWRREGLIARIRMAGFNVHTLQDRIDALHAAPVDIEPGPEVFRVLATQREQIAAWDPERLRWRDLPVREVNGVRGVTLRVNEPLRRRKSRSGGDYLHRDRRTRWSCRAAPCARKRRDSARLWHARC